MRRYAFGAIDLLIGLLIIGAICVLSMKTFQNTSPISNGSNIKNVRQQVDEQVDEIERMKRESEELQRELLKNQSF